MPRSWPRSTLASSRGAWADGAALDSGTSTEKREPRPALGAQVDLVIEHAPDALDDREAEAQAARHLGALVEPVEFAEDRPPSSTPGMPRPVSYTSMRSRPRTAPAADQHAALRRVFDRVGDEVLQQPPQQPPVGADGERAGHELQIEALLARERREFDLELAQQFVDAEADELRPHRAGVEPRNVEQRAENLLDRFERGIDVADQPRRPRRSPCRSISEVT